MNMMKRSLSPLTIMTSLAFLTGCASTASTTPRTSTHAGSYYQDDGPLRGVTERDMLMIPDPIARRLPLHQGAQRPYSVFGKRYTPSTELKKFKQTGIASWYGTKYHGKPTSTGEPFDVLKITAAHTTLPLPSFVRIRNLENGRTIIARLNDRGPFLRDRIIDVSYAAAVKLGFATRGSARVEIESILP